MARNNTQQTPILNIPAFSHDANANAAILQRNFAQESTPNPNSNLVTTTQYDTLGNVLMQPDSAGMKYLYGNSDTDGAAAHDLATRNGWLQGPGYIIIPHGDSVSQIPTDPNIPPPVVPPVIPATIDTADKMRYALPADMVALLAQRYSIPQQYGTNFLDAANPGNNPLGSVIGAGALQGGIDQLYTALKRNQIANDFSKLTGNTITRDANGNWYMMQGDKPVALSPAQAWQLTLAKNRNTYESTRTLQGGIDYSYDINKNINGLPQGGGASTSGGSSAGAAANAGQVEQSMNTARQAQRQIGR